MARELLQRGLGLVYLLAFFNALEQFPALLGENGLMPATRFVKAVPFRESPSLFHLLGYSDRLLRGVSLVGIGLSIAVIAGAIDHLPVVAGIFVWLALWALYLSIVNVGQTFYGFGWESLLLEAGFLAAFLGPAQTPAPLSILWLFRWLLFRLEFGAGLIKLRGDACWRDLTCLYYHHETQPMPNPLSWHFHWLPRPLHRVEVLGSHFAQLVAPVLLFLPQPIAGFAALVMAVTQSWLVLSGNFSWLNLTTIVLCASAIPSAGVLVPPGWFGAVALAVTAVVVALSYRPAMNLVSRRQKMNASFDPLHLVSTYGAFGSISRERFEVVVEGTRDLAEWRAYEFKGKPTDVRRRPSQWAPYHLRLDWLMWFAAISPSYAYSWFVPFLRRLLLGDRAVLRLLRENPFPDAPPKAIRALLYRYRFTTPAERRESGAFWSRELVGEYMRPIGGETAYVS